MKNPSRFLALWLALALGLPSPALALRAVGLEESNQQPVLREALAGTSTHQPEAGLEEDPIVAALKQGPVTIAVDAVGVARINGRGAPIAIPTELKQPGFFEPNSQTTIVRPKDVPWFPDGMTVLDQAGVMSADIVRHWGVTSYHDLRHITTSTGFENAIYSTVSGTETAAVFHRASIQWPAWIVPVQARWIIVGLPPEYVPHDAFDLFALLSVARRAGGQITIGAIVGKQLIGDRVLLIAA